jgi:hypothetical protein
MIIFVHMLKAGGTSFRTILEERYGARLLRDYDDIPMSNRPEHHVQRAERLAWVREHAGSLDADIVFGHFVMDKYRGLRPDLRFGTMFRDPAARIVSHYFHYLRNIGGARNEILEQGISLVEFARLPKYRDMYQYLLGAMAVTDLDYVGITEDFEASVDLFFRIFPAPRMRLPVGDSGSMFLNRASEYRDAVEYLRQHRILQEVVAAQRINYEIYNEAKARFAMLRNEYGACAAVGAAASSQ